MTQRFSPNLLAAVYLSLACSIVLGGFSGFHAREAALTVLPATVLMLCAVRLPAAYLPYSDRIVTPFLVVALLIFSSGYEILALWQLYLAAYHGDVALGVVVTAVLIPTIYLRRKAPLTQSGNFLLVLLGLVMVLMLVSVVPQLRITNLSTERYDVATIVRAGSHELAMTPELLIVAMFLPTAVPEKSKAKSSIAVKAVSLLCFGRLIICVLLELFYGDAIMWRSDAFHTATASGTISMFKRMEWLQLLLWTLAVSVKVALFFYSAWAIKRKNSIRTAFIGDSTAVPARGWIVMAFTTAILISLLKNVDFRVLQSCLTGITWTIWLIITMGGFLRCTLSKRKAGA